HMLQEKWDEAESLLQDSLDRDNNNPDTILNLYVTSQHLGKSTDICKRFLRQLEEIQPSYCFLEDFKRKESEFDETSQQLST
ncbi:hypothetical protein, partial [Salmonella sp. s51228]|uniref:hypothetical protein n=1 Tax=Salmonella sp. s51228 TaxID=3159652 RepID=UPI00397E9FE7